ncbi:MAG: redoxin domain-containing protein [Candidatus Acidiferrales bacterium]|jgi:peroxiredoxin
MCLRQLANYRDHASGFRDAGFDLAALAVDEPVRSEAVRRENKLPFPILCDTRREVIEAWGIINHKEKGGIAEPAIFVVDRGRRVLFGSVDGEFSRVGAAALLEALRNHSSGANSPAPRRHFIIATLGDYWRAARGVIRFGVRSSR